MNYRTFLLLGLGIFLLHNNDAYAREPVIDNGPAPRVPTIAPKKFHPRCQSYTNCSFRINKVLDQGERSIVDAMDGNRNTCAPTAAAMLLSTILDEKLSSTKPLAGMLKLSQTNSQPSRVRILGEGFGTGTDGSKTGTMPFNLPFIDNMSKYFNRNFFFSGAKEYTLDKSGSLFTYPKASQNDFINDIRNNKHGFLLTVTSHHEKGNKWIRDTDDGTGLGGKIIRASGHVLALTGFNGDRLQIHDPWGYVYFVNAKQEKIKTCGLCFKADKTVLYPAGSSNGFVASVNSRNKKSIIRQYFKMKAY